MQAIRSYAFLMKPGIIFGNIVTALGGFALASKSGFHPMLCLAMLVGLTGVIGGGCVFNNYIDRASDRKMNRTKNRALANGSIPEEWALLFGCVVAFCGFFVLAVCTNALTTMAALVGFCVYVFVYSFLKYQWTYTTLVGSIAGAMPPVIGYCTVAGRFDMSALLLFLMVTFWQMPHFFAISLYRIDDYAQAAIPVFPLAKGARATKWHTVFYVLCFLFTSIALAFVASLGVFYLIVMGTLGSIWLYLSIQGFWSSDEHSWARRMFLFSLIIIMALSVVIPFS